MRTGHPVWIRRRSRVHEIGLAHRARERGTGDDSIKEQFCIPDRDTGCTLDCTLVVLLPERDHARHRGSGIARFGGAISGAKCARTVRPPECRTDANAAMLSAGASASRKVVTPCWFIALIAAIAPAIFCSAVGFGISVEKTS